MKKALSILLSAVLFGVVAGATMYGVNLAAKNLVKQEAAAQGIENKTEESGAAKQETAAAVQQETSAAAPEVKKEKVEVETGRVLETASSQPAMAAVLDVSGIVEEAMPQVVSITNTMLIRQKGYSSIFDYYYGGGITREYEVPASGSGVIMQQTDKELLIVTNNHVIEDSKELMVSFIDGESANAYIKGSADDMDVAVIAVSLDDIPAETLKAIKIANLHSAEDLKVGEGVIAIGNALGLGQTVTVGYISALNREIRTEEGTESGLIQVDAAINPGNSGGALLNMKGEVIGINVAKYAKTEVEGVGYSIPIYQAMDAIENLARYSTKKEVAEENQGRLGVYLNTITEQDAKAFHLPEGVMVTGFSDEEMEGYGKDYVAASPAKEAGMLKNDIITNFDGQSVKTAEALVKLVRYYEAGQEVVVKVQRLEGGEYREREIRVILGKKQELPAESQAQESEAQDAEGPGPGTEQQPGNDEDYYELFRQFMEQYR